MQERNEKILRMVRVLQLNIQRELEYQEEHPLEVIKEKPIDEPYFENLYNEQKIELHSAVRYNEQQQRELALARSESDELRKENKTLREKNEWLRDSLRQAAQQLDTGGHWLASAKRLSDSKDMFGYADTARRILDTSK